MRPAIYDPSSRTSGRETRTCAPSKDTFPYQQIGQASLWTPCHPPNCSCNQHHLQSLVSGRVLALVRKACLLFPHRSIWYSCSHLGDASKTPAIWRKATSPPSPLWSRLWTSKMEPPGLQHSCMQRSAWHTTASSIHAHTMDCMAHYCF